MNARLYDPLLARFLGPDPQVSETEISNGFNRYAYASNNPMMYVDLNGESNDKPGIHLYPGFSFPGQGNTSNDINTGSNNYGNSLYYPGNSSNSGSQGGIGNYGGNYGGCGGGPCNVTFGGLGSVVVAHVSQDSYKTILTNTNTSNSYKKKSP